MDDSTSGTDRCNLGCLCKYHHDLKHHAGWHLYRDPDDHTATWTSATGHSYHVDHHDQRGTTTPTRAATLTDDSELRWSDEILTDIDWDNIDWQDRDYFVPAPTVGTTTVTAAPATIAAEDPDEVCPF